MYPGLLFIMLLLVCAADRVLAQGTRSGVLDEPIAQVQVDGDGVLYFLSSASHQLWQRDDGVYRNIGPDADVLTFEVASHDQLLATDGGDVYRREVGGGWTPRQLPLGTITALASDTLGTWYMAAEDVQRAGLVYRSRNRGESWTLYRKIDSSGIDMLSVSPGGDIYINSYRAGPQVSTNGGTSWQPVDIDRTLRVMHYTPQGAPVVASGYTAVYYYSDSTGTWHEPARTLGRLHLTAFASHPVRASDGSASIIYGCNAIGDIVRSTDRGVSWGLLIYGGSYPTGIVNDIAADSTYLYVAAQNGLWQFHHADSTFEPVGSVSSVSVSDQRVLSNGFQPNPATGRSTLHVDVPGGSRVVISLYDGYGRRVRTLLDEFRQSGPIRLPLEVDDLPSGIYHCRIVAGHTATLHRLVVTR